MSLFIHFPQLTAILRYLLGLTGAIIGLLIFLTYIWLQEHGIEEWLDAVSKDQLALDFKVLVIGHLAMTGGFLVYVYAGYTNLIEITNISRITSLVFSTSLIIIFFRWWRRTV
ncbi:MAG: hypothetical protein SVU32_03545 [Candidatus Nanohaloarchaea archaeon]|nr:hypothetical protein [Candidatus Nanohaloarchaea archaeon]